MVGEEGGGRQEAAGLGGTGSPGAEHGTGRAGHRGQEDGEEDSDGLGGWEDVHDHDGPSPLEAPASAAAAAVAAAAGAGGGSGGALTITLRADGSEAWAGKQQQPGPKPQRRGFTKADREAAALVHQAHLLCLLARGLLYDGAACDPGLQATLLSLLPPGPEQPAPAQAAAAGGGGPSTARIGGEGGSAGPSAGQCCRLSSLVPLLEWFQATFRLLPSAQAQQLGGRPQRQPQQAGGGEEEGDEIAAAVAAAKGVPGVVEELYKVRVGVGVGVGGSGVRGGGRRLLRVLGLGGGVRFKSGSRCWRSASGWGWGWGWIWPLASLGPAPSPGLPMWAAGSHATPSPPLSPSCPMCASWLARMPHLPHHHHSLPPAPRLQVVERRCGSPEQLVALFVALLRGRGLAARSLRALEPSPLRPGDAQRWVCGGPRGGQYCSEPRCGDAQRRVGGEGGVGGIRAGCSCL